MDILRPLNSINLSRVSLSVDSEVKFSQVLLAQKSMLFPTHAF